jgi:hypothetical protein
MIEVIFYDIIKQQGSQVSWERRVAKPPNNPGDYSHTMRGVF